MVAIIKPNAGSLTKRGRYDTLRTQLDSERSSFIAHWRDLADFILPRRARFTITDNNQGGRVNTKIIDNTGTLAARTLQSGMMAGLTSPARPWFRLTVSDPFLAEIEAVKIWLHDVTTRMRTVMLRSNLYNTLPTVYADISTFGTSAFFVEEDFSTVFRTYPFPVGTYYLANDSKGRVRVFMREFRYTVRQVVEKFAKVSGGKYDFSNISSYVQEQWESEHYDTWIDIVHAVVPNEEHDPDKVDPVFKKFAEVYYERGTSFGKEHQQTDSDQEKFLMEQGRDYFPVLAPRWEVSDGDVYATNCPGMIALGDIKQLQVEQRRKSQALEKMVKPPMVGPASLRSVKSSILPGDMTYIDERDGQKGFRPAHDVKLNLRDLTDDIRDVRVNVSRAYFEDLFLMLARSDRREITATEIDERKEEKLLALGPVLEQANQDMLDPLIDIIYLLMENHNLIPEPPEELQGRDLKVEYISVMAQSQKLLGINTLERFTNYSAELAKITEDRRVLHKVNWESAIEDYGDRSGVNPNLIRSGEEVDAIVAQELEAQRNAEAMEEAKVAAAAAKDLSNANLADDSILKRVISGAQQQVA